jgi:hypothetical protein
MQKFSQNALFYKVKAQTKVLFNRSNLYVFKSHTIAFNPYILNFFKKTGFLIVGLSNGQHEQ